MKALQFITENWEYISAAAAGVVGLVIRLVPTNKNLDLVSKGLIKGLKFLDKIIPNRKKDGGTH
jgi:hypothetical protein